MLIQNPVRYDSIIASKRLIVEFCNTIGPNPKSKRVRSYVGFPG